MLLDKKRCAFVVDMILSDSPLLSQLLSRTRKRPLCYIWKAFDIPSC